MYIKNIWNIHNLHLSKAVRHHSMTTRGFNLIIGPHVNRDQSKKQSITKHIQDAISDAKSGNAFVIGAVQIFMSNPKGKAIILKDTDKSELNSFAGSSGVRIIAHNSYAAVPWSGNAENIKFINDALQVCKESGIDGLVVHLPKAAMSKVLPILKQFIIPSDVVVYLETPAISPKETYYESPSKLNALFAEIDNINIGLCIDTAHLWTCGVDVSTYTKMDSWLSELDLQLIPNVMIHLNDSEKNIGVGPDSHAPLMDGKIWKGIDIDDSGCIAMISWAASHSFPVILERSPKEMLPSDYRLVNEMISILT
jgi:endonuclease IV